MHYGFDEDENAFRAELRRWAEKVLAPHYQDDDRAATFRRQQALDMAQMGDVEAGLGAHPQTSLATSRMRASLAHCSSSASTLPSSVEAKPHCGDRQS